MCSSLTCVCVRCVCVRVKSVVVVIVRRVHEAIHVVDDRRNARGIAAETGECVLSRTPALTSSYLVVLGSLCLRLLSFWLFNGSFGLC
jgi:hypothetical protein